MIKINQPQQHSSETFQITPHLRQLKQEGKPTVLQQMWQGSQGRRQWRDITSIPEYIAPVVEEVAPVAIAPANKTQNSTIQNIKDFFSPEEGE